MNNKNILEAVQDIERAVALMENHLSYRRWDPCSALKNIQIDELRHYCGEITISLNRLKAVME